MKIFYLILTLFATLSLSSQLQAQHLNQQESQQLKKYLDKHLLPAFAAAKAKAQSTVKRNSNFSSLSDSIHTLSKFAEADPYGQGINYYFTFDVVDGKAVVTKIDIKIFDPEFPVDNIEATPTYDSQDRISKITMNTLVVGFPINILNYFYNYDSKGNTTSLILESPGVFGTETSYQGDSIQFTYDAQNRVSSYNAYYLVDTVWTFNNGVSAITYDVNNNVNSLISLLPGGDTLTPVPTPFYAFRDIEWYEDNMPATFINPLGSNSSDVEAELTGIEIAVAEEDYKLEPIAYIQSSYVDNMLIDSTVVRTFEEVSGRFTLLDAYYETGDFIYTQITNYHYNGQDQLISREILYDLGFGDPVPLDKTDYEHNEYGLIKSEFFNFDQGQWISMGAVTYDFIVVDNELLEYTETFSSETEYESYKTIFFPSDILETSVNETQLSADVIHVFPTQVKGNVTVNFPQFTGMQDVLVNIWSINGKLVLTQSFDSAYENVEINVSSLSSGLYLLNVQVPGGMRTVRFVKE